MMSSCCCYSAIRATTPLIRQPDNCGRWISNPRPPLRFSLTRNTNYKIRVVQDGIGVLPPEDKVSLQSSAVIDDTTEKEEFHGLLAQEPPVQETPPKNRIVKKKNEYDDDDDTRFKLRNGREVCIPPKPPKKEIGNSLATTYYY